MKKIFKWDPKKDPTPRLHLNCRCSAIFTPELLEKAKDKACEKLISDILAEVFIDSAMI